MMTVGDRSPATVSTVKQWGLSPLTLDIVQPDRIRSLTVCCTMGSRGSAGKTKLTTHHVSIIDIPVIIAHCAPLPTVINFNAAIVSTSIHQTNHWTTLNTGISAVSTVIVSPSTVPTIVNMRLASRAGHVIYPDGTWNPGRDRHRLMLEQLTVENQAACRQRWHHSYPKHHRKLCPTDHHRRLRLFQLIGYHPSDELIRVL